jgi:hypothetical protein
MIDTKEYDAAMNGFFDRWKREDEPRQWRRDAWRSTTSVGIHFGCGVSLRDRRIRSSILSSTTDSE